MNEGTVRVVVRCSVVMVPHVLMRSEVRRCGVLLQPAAPHVAQPVAVDALGAGVRAAAPAAPAAPATAAAEHGRCPAPPRLALSCTRSHRRTNMHAASVTPVDKQSHTYIKPVHFYKASHTYKLA